MISKAEYLKIGLTTVVLAMIGLALRQLWGTSVDVAEKVLGSLIVVGIPALVLGVWWMRGKNPEQPK